MMTMIDSGFGMMPLALLFLGAVFGAFLARWQAHRRDEALRQENRVILAAIHQAIRQMDAQ